MSGFVSPNFTQTPNDLWDMLPAMHEAELKVTLAAIRHTFGFHRKKVKLSITAMEKLTGLSRQGVLNGAEAAEERGTLTRTSDGGTTVWVVNVVDYPPDMVVHSVDYPPKPVNTVDQSGQHSRPEGVNRVDHPSIKEKKLKKDSKKEGAPAPPATTNAIKAAYLEELGYEIDDWGQGESTAAKAIAGKWTVEQFREAYRHYKKQPFWKDKRITLRYLKGQIPEYHKNGSSPAVPEDAHAEYLRLNPHRRSQ